MRHMLLSAQREPRPGVAGRQITVPQSTHVHQVDLSLVPPWAEGPASHLTMAMLPTVAWTGAPSAEELDARQVPQTKRSGYRFEQVLAAVPVASSKQLRRKLV
jgi:hypothetical protein